MVILTNASHIFTHSHEYREVYSLVHSVLQKPSSVLQTVFFSSGKSVSLSLSLCLSLSVCLFLPTSVSHWLLPIPSLSLTFFHIGEFVLRYITPQHHHNTHHIIMSR